MFNNIKEKFRYYGSYLLFIVWVSSIIILFGIYWNDYKINIKQEADLLIEIRKSNMSMQDTEKFRLYWNSILKGLEERQKHILIELDELHKLRELTLKNQVEIINKLDRLIK